VAVKTDLRLDWCSYEAAKYAVEHWHYSRCMPVGKLVKIGVWEAGQFIGCVLFGRGANNHIGQPYGLTQNECCELVRVALSEHVSPVTRIVACALRFLRSQSPGIRLVVSYADPEQGHVGSIYQAGNWLYVGTSCAQADVMYKGVKMHKRTAVSKFGSAAGMVSSAVFYKLKYLMPLDDAMRKQIEPLRQPYPKRPPDRGTLANEDRQCEPDPAAPDIAQDVT